MFLLVKKIILWYHLLGDIMLEFKNIQINEAKSFKERLIGLMFKKNITYGLLFNAKKFKKQATAIVTISDNLITHEEINSEERERKLDEMIMLALESIIKN